MKTNHKKKPMTFGEFIVGIYNVCGKNHARKIVEVAVNAHLIVFKNHRRFLVS